MKSNMISTLEKICMKKYSSYQVKIPPFPRFLCGMWKIFTKLCNIMYAVETCGFTLGKDIKVIKLCNYAVN